MPKGEQMQVQITASVAEVGVMDKALKAYRKTQVFAANASAATEEEKREANLDIYLVDRLLGAHRE
jgi:hypothetical protein